MQANRSARRCRQSVKAKARLLAALAAGIFSGPSSASAIADTWLWTGGGAGSGNIFWSDGVNWTHSAGSSGSATPVSNINTIVQFAGSTNISPFQDIASPLALNSLVFNAGSSSFSLQDNPLEFFTNSASVAPTIVQNSSNAQSILESISLNNNTTLTFTGSGAGAIALEEPVSGSSGSLVVSGSAPVQLFATNTYAGGTTLSGGTLVINNNDALGTGSLTFNSGTLVANSSATVSNTLAAGAAAIGFQAASGATLTISSSSGLFGSLNFGSSTNNGTVNFEPGSFNFFGGQINVNGGTLLDGADALSQILGSYSVSIASGATFNVNGFSSTMNNLTGAGTLATGSSSPIITLSSANFSGTITGGGQIATNGGNVILSGPSTFVGGTNLAGGTVGAGNSSAFGSNTVTVSANTNLYAAGANQSLFNVFTLNSGKTLTVQDDPSTPHNLSLIGNIGGSGAIVMSSTGSLTLNGSNTYTGGTTINSGTVIINNNKSLGAGTLTFNSGALVASSNVTLSNILTATASPISFQAAPGASFLVNTSGTVIGSVNFGSSTETGTVDFVPRNGMTAGGEINADGGTVFDGSGVLSGILQVYTVSIVSGATLNVNGFSSTIKNLAGAGTLATGSAGGNTITLPLADVAGVITGAAAVKTVTGGTVQFFGSNTYSGGTVFAGGIVGAANNLALGTGGVSVTAGTTLYAESANRLLANPISIASGQTLTIVDDPAGANNLTLSGPLSGSGSLVMSGTGGLSLFGPNSYSGGTTLNSGEIAVNSNTGLGTGPVTLNAGTIAAAASAAISASLNTTSTSSLITFQAIPSATLTLAGPTSFKSQQINFGTPGNTGTVDFDQAGPSFFSPATYDINDGTLLAGNSVLSTALALSTVVIAPPATLNLNNQNSTINNLTGCGTLVTGTSNTNSVTLNAANFSGPITGTGQIATSGGTDILSGASTYGGGSNFAGGTLGAGNDAALSTFPVSVSASTSLYAAAADHTLANAISINSGQTLTVIDDPTGAHNLTLGGNISGSGSLVMNGTGALSLFGSSSFTGGTTLNSGQMILSGNNALGGGPLTVNGGTITAAANAAINVSFVDQSLATITLQAAAGTTLTLAGPAGFESEQVNFGSAGETGTVNYAPIAITHLDIFQFDINGGTLFNGNGALSQSLPFVNVSIAPSATLDLNSGAASIGNLTGSGTLAMGPSNTSQVTLSNANFSGPITGTGQLATNGGTVILSGSSAFTGGSDLLGGTVGIGNNKALGSGTITVDASTNIYAAAALRTITNPIFLTTSQRLIVTNDPSGAQQLVFGGSIVGSGTLVLSGTGVTRLTTGNSYSGGTIINSGTLGLAATNALPFDSSVVNNGTVAVNASIMIAAITGSGTTNIGTAAASTLQLELSSSASTQGALNILTGSTLDITNNKLVLNYTIDPITSITTLLTRGYNAGTWTGTGITSSAAAVRPTTLAVGYLDGNRAADALGNHIAPNQIIIKYTLLGDAFLENSVGFDDLVVVAQNFGKTGQDWAQGNFNYDPSGTVGFADLVVVAQNFGFSWGVNEGGAGGGLSPAWQAASAVPEPTAATLVAAGSASLFLRRRRRS